MEKSLKIVAAVFYKPDALPITQPTAAKHRRKANQKLNQTSTKGTIGPRRCPLAY